MRLLLSGMVAAGVLTLAIAAYAQSTTPTPAVPSNPAAAAPVPSGKRFACKTASQALKGQEQKDQVQLCRAQARLDCQASDRPEDRRPATKGFCQKLRGIEEAKKFL